MSAQAGSVSSRDLEASLWYATAGAPPRLPVLDGELRCDVAVIGGGYTGLSAALHLAEEGRCVAVVGAHEPGHGASGRNAAGWVPTWLDQHPEHVSRVYGATGAARLNQMLAESGRLLLDLVTRYRMDCDLAHSGCLFAAHAANAAQQTQHLVSGWNACSGAVEWLDRQRAADLLDTERFHGAALFRDAGTLQPLKYARELARAVGQQGARVFARSPAMAVEPLGDLWRVRTPGGALVASHVLLATDAYPAVAGLWPALERSYYAVPAAMVATDPAPDLEQMLPARIPVSDTNRLQHFWLMLDAQRRLVTSTYPPHGDEREPAHVAVSYEHKLRQIFSRAPAIRWRYFWIGMLAVTPARLPRMLALARGVHAIGGYSGQGITAATAAGREYARFITGSGTSCRLPIVAPRPVPMRRAIPRLLRHVAFPLMCGLDRSYR